MPDRRGRQALHRLCDSILLAVLALFAVSQAVAAPQYYVADSLYYGYPYSAYYGAYYPYYYYGR
ncbi:uncharacterized protein LOC119163232 [Rhipicephalus microplus]|uniref:uncharacterized protein LOC119163232 n=1 Tax=Rhipicephalus microplus TaxID=6941 RepID=UPI003F6A97EC